MKFKVLGRTGVQVSELCFGTMSFGGDADPSESARMYTACRDRGINFFDCANVYQRGVSETILGKLMKGQRDELIITTKAYGNMNSLQLALALRDNDWPVSDEVFDLLEQAKSAKR